MTSLVGVDIGTSGVKALALSPEGEVVGRAEEEYPLSIPQPGWAEQDPNDWVKAAESAVKEAQPQSIEPVLPLVTASKAVSPAPAAPEPSGRSTPCRSAP